MVAEQGVNVGLHDLLPCGPIQAWPIHMLARLIDWALVVAAGVMIVLVFFNVCVHAAGHDLAASTVFERVIAAELSA